MTTHAPLPTRRENSTQHATAAPFEALLEKVGDLLTGVKFEPCGPVVGHDRLKHCTSLPDLIGRHLLVEYCGREELADGLVGQGTAPALNTGQEGRA